MAEKRMISKVISISEKVNMLPDIFDMLLFTWIIPHTDDFGRLAGSPAKVKALVVPMLDKSLREVDESIQRLHDQGLILCYEVDGEKVIQIINFEKHQQGLHKRTRSKFPDPPNNSDNDLYFPGNSRNFPTFPPEEKGRELNRTEKNGIEEEGNGTGDSATLSPGSNPHKDSILKLIQECKVEKCDLFSLDIIYSFIGAVKIEVIEAAIKKSSNKHINYAINTLKNWLSEGKTTIEQINPPTKVAPFKGKTDKPHIPIVESTADAQPVSEEEMAELMKLVDQMKDYKKKETERDKSA
jgi:hypothetical protein